MTEKVQADISASSLEYTGFFESPILGAWDNSHLFIATVLSPLEQFGFDVEHIEARIATPKLSEYGILFERNPPGLRLLIGLSKIVVTADNPDLSEADQLTAGMSVAIETVLKAGKTKFKLQRLGLGMHVPLRNVLRKDVTAPLVNPAVLRLMDGETKASGIVLTTSLGSIIIDASVASENGLYIRIYRDHPGETSLKDISEALLNDEKKVLGLLGIDGVL